MAYSQSKLANLLFAYELARKKNLHRLSVIAMHPGLTQSQLGRDLKGFMRFLPLLLRPFMQKAEKAAFFLEQLLELPPSTEPLYFIKNKLSQSSSLSYDKELSSKLWAISESLIKVV